MTPNFCISCRCGLHLAAELTLPTDEGTTTGSATCTCGDVYDLAVVHLTGTGAEARYEFKVKMKAPGKAALLPLVP